LCGDDANTPPTALATTATITTTTIAGGINCNGSVYCYGLNFNCATGAVNINHWFGSSTQKEKQFYEDCHFSILTTGANSRWLFGSGGRGEAREYTFKNCVFKTTTAMNALFEPLTAIVKFIGGCSIDATSAVPTTLIGFGRTSSNNGGIVYMQGFDLSLLGSGKNLVDVSGNSGAVENAAVYIRDCKLGSSVAVTTGTYAGLIEVKLHNSDSADTNYRLHDQTFAGTTTNETTIVKTSGASDGTTALAWKMATSANAKYPVHALYSPERAVWNETTGSAKTLTVEIVHDSQGAGSGSKFQDDEVWLEVMYLGTSGFPLGTWITDCKADVLATAADQADSSVTWTTTGLTSPVKQALAVTFTPQEKGHFIYRIAMAKASKTCYIDPVVTVT
jgi:hypothetical protein